MRKAGSTGLLRILLGYCSSFGHERVHELSARFACSRPIYYSSRSVLIIFAAYFFDSLDISVNYIVIQHRIDGTFWIPEHRIALWKSSKRIV